MAGMWNVSATHVNNFSNNLVECVDFSDLSGATVGCFTTFSSYKKHIANSRGDSCVLGVYISNVSWGLIFCFRKVSSFKRLKSLLNLRKAYIYQESAEDLLLQEFAEALLSISWRSIIDLCLQNFPKRSSFKSLLKVYYIPSKVCWRSAIGK